MVEAYTNWIRHLAALHHRLPDWLGQPDIRSYFVVIQPDDPGLISREHQHAVKGHRLGI